MAAHVGPRLHAAARLRGPGAGAFLGPARALSAALRRGQHAGRQLHDAGELLSRAAAADEAAVPQAADPDDAEVDAAQQARGVAARRASASGTAFHRILLDKAETWKSEKIKLAKDDKIRRVVICSGKVYWDLYEEREKRGIDDVYLLRCEQLYPFPLKRWCSELSRFKKAEVVWCQEEPKNMGAWFFVEPYMEWVLGQVGGKSKRARYAGRPAAAATATGLMSKHLAQLKAFLDECFA